MMKMKIIHLYADDCRTIAHFSISCLTVFIKFRSLSLSLRIVIACDWCKRQVSVMSEEIPGQGKTKRCNSLIVISWLKWKVICLHCIFVLLWRRWRQHGLLIIQGIISTAFSINFIHVIVIIMLWFRFTHSFHFACFILPHPFDVIRLLYSNVRSTAELDFEC